MHGIVKMDAADKPKRKKPTPLDARTRHWLERIGYTVDKCTHWNSFARRRIDLFAIADLFAFDEFKEILVQPTSSANVAAHVNALTRVPVDLDEKKMKFAARRVQTARRWVSKLNRMIMVVGWAKTGDRGKRKTWPDVPPRIVYITEEMFS